MTEARRLWSRLDELFPTGPEDPEEGFGPGAIELARMGGIYIQIASEESTMKAWGYWMSIRRSLLHSGRDESEMFEDYVQAVAEYRKRHQEERDRRG